MTDVRDDNLPEDDVTAQAKAEAQRRIEEIMSGQADAEATAEKSRRTRLILTILLILLLLMLCGVGFYLWKMLNPKSGATADELNGIQWIRSVYGYGPAAAQQLTSPNDSVTGPDGTIWVADPAKNEIIGFRGDGSYVSRMLGNRQTGKPFRTPSRITVDNDGIMYVVDRPNSQLTIMDGSSVLATTTIPGLTSVDVADDIVVAGAEAGFAILDKDGNVKTIVGTKGSGKNQFDTVGGVAIDSVNKSIYVVDTFNNRLSAWDYNGKQKWQQQLGNAGNKVKLEGGASLQTSSTAPARLQMPVDVTVDGRGRPLVLDGFDFSITAFDPADGKFVSKWGTYGDADGKFLYPTALSYDRTKDWITVADTSNGRMQIIRVDGTAAPGLQGMMSGLRALMAGPLRALWPFLLLIPLLIAFYFIRRRMQKRALEQAQSPSDTAVSPQ